MALFFPLQPLRAPRLNAAGTEPFVSLGDAGRSRIIHQQTLIADYEAEAAITTLPSLLKTADERAKAIATIKDIAGPSEEMDESTARMLAMLEQVLASPAAAPLPPPLSLPSSLSLPMSLPSFSCLSMHSNW